MRSGGLLFLVTGLLLSAGAGRLAYLQAHQGLGLQEQARDQQTVTVRIPPRRGDIVDTKGRLLAGSVRRPSVFVDPYLLQDPAERRYAICSLAPVLDLAPETLAQLILEDPKRRFAWVKRRISSQEAAAFREVKRARRLIAFGLQEESERTYPNGRLACHVLGFVGDPVAGVARGLAGVELAFDEALTGKGGYRRSTVDARRRRLRSYADDYVPPQDGATVVLTLDTYVQERTERYLRQAAEEHGAEWATAVVLDPCSGEVLAMAAVPDFDPAEPVPAGLSRAEAYDALRNRAITDAFEPGSIFKPFIAAAAVNDDLTALTEVFEINGPQRRFGGHTLHDTHKYDRLCLREIISRSSNIGMALVGLRCGNERLHEYVRRFGFGRESGINLPGEHAGLVNPLANWTSYSTRSVPFGQELGVTALQVAAAFSSLANGGTLYRPRAVRGLLGPGGETLADWSEPAPVRRVLDRDVALRFRLKALVEVVNGAHGSGHRARLDDYRVFGKTGTAQIAKPAGGGYRRGVYAGSFVGGAPADEPRVVAIVSLYGLAGRRYYGGTVAAPAVGKILSDTLAYMQIPPEVVPVDQHAIMGALP